MTLSAGVVFFAPLCNGQQAFLKLKTNALLFGRDTSAARRVDSGLTVNLPLGSITYDIYHRTLRFKWDSTANWTEGLYAIPDSAARTTRGAIRQFQDGKIRGLELVPSWRDSVGGVTSDTLNKVNHFTYYTVWAGFGTVNDSSYTAANKYFPNGAISYALGTERWFGFVAADTLEPMEVGIRVDRNLDEGSNKRFMDTTISLLSASAVPAGEAWAVQYHPGSASAWVKHIRIVKMTAAGVLTDLHGGVNTQWPTIPRRYVFSINDAMVYVTIKFRIKHRS